MCYEFDRWNWKFRAKRRDERVIPAVMPTQATKRDAPQPAKEPVREVKTPDKMPA